MERASAIGPDRPEAAFLTCVTLIESGDGQARSVLEDLLLRFPNFVEGWREIAEALRKSGHAETAVIAFARAAESSAASDGHARDWARRFRRSTARGRPSSLFDGRLTRRPISPKRERRLGRCFRQAGELQLARVELERALALRLGDGRAWFALGLVCEDLRDTPGAIEAYRQSIEAQPDIPEVHVNLGLNLQNAGDLDAAMDPIDALCVSAPIRSVASRRR